MAQNRLKLNFSLEFIDERANFVSDYLNQEQFKNKPPTKAELETISNYILWGKNREDGKNAVQRKELEIETKSKTWNQKDSKVESLDALVESPAFNENTIIFPGEAMTKIQRTTFSRTEARKRTDPSLLPLLEELFRRIDETELLINLYELAHNKRKKPPREELISRFTKDEISALDARAQTLSQYQFLKLKHLLVELRLEQYMFRDSYTNPILCDSSNSSMPPQNLVTKIGVDIPVFPLGLFWEEGISQKIFVPLAQLTPKNFSEEELKKISNLIWTQKSLQEKLGEEDRFFDFSNQEHLYNFLLLFEDLEDAAARETLEYQMRGFLSTLNYYMEISELSEAQREIINFKMRGFQNQHIAAVINQKYGKSYTVNYISTIFRQKAIPTIIEAVNYHLRVCENLFFPEEFKECNTCRRVLLRDSYNFVRKSRAKDGFTNRCKRCDKADRERKKS